MVRARRGLNITLFPASVTSGFAYSAYMSMLLLPGRMCEDETRGIDMPNVKQIQEIYAAFGRGDVPAILAALADDVEWEYGVNSTEVPWLQPRRGRAEVKTFFEALAAVEISKFQPRTFLETENTVVTLVDVEMIVKASGRKVIEEDEVHIWRFDGQGRIIRFRHRVDTHQHLMALRP